MDLSIIIPARNEMFLAKTIEDILEHSEANTEVITTLDGGWVNPPIQQHDRVNVVYVPEPIGQRAAANLAAKLARGKYIMKVDAHCSFDQGFDRVMLDGFSKEPDADVCTMAPVMRNLWVFDWKCYSCGKRFYQGPTPTQPCNAIKRDGSICGAINYKRKLVWKGKSNPQSRSFCFDAEPHFQYFNEYKERLEYKEMLEKTGLTETMSLQGSCFMATKEMYWKLKLCDESFGSWGNQGIEVACKTWLSGGRVLVNHGTWYAHLFRTQGGDFGFPYHQSGIQKTKQAVWDFLLDSRWEERIYPVSWLVEKFWPVRGWTEEDLARLKERESWIGDLEVDRLQAQG